MTLLITVVTPDTIFQSADHQLTMSGPAGLRVVSKNSAKIVTIGGEKWDGFISYTGIGRDGPTDTSKLLLRWLSGLQGEAITFAERIRDRGTAWLRRFPGYLHTFLLVAASESGAEVFKISNFEDLHGRYDTRPDSILRIDSRRMREGIVVCGQRASVARPAVLLLRAEMRARGADPGRMRRLLRRVNAQAARSANQTVSPTCDVFSMRRDGRGHFDYEGGATARSITLGTAMPELDELLRQIGFSGTLVSGVSSRSGPRIPYATCNPAIIATPTGADYTIEELTQSRLASFRATGINGSGVIIGTSAPSNQPQAPWLLRPGSSALRCAVSANTAGIAADGTVAITAHMSDNSERAALWDGTQVVPLGVYKGRSSGATAIAGDFVVGWVCVDPVDQGQRNFRPAGWSGSGGRLNVWEQVPFTWGQCVDVREDGMALVLGYHEQQPGAYLWNLGSGEARLVGNGIGAYPMALSDNGTVLATLQSPGGSIAYTSMNGDNWQELGLPAGYYATCINARGDVAGAAVRDGYEQPWIFDGTAIKWLPYFRDHWCRPAAIADNGTVVGAATADHGSHAVAWRRPD